MQKLSEPGYSTIQKIDAVHRVIDQHFKHLNIYSPVSLLYQLNSFSYPNVSLDIYQMRDKDFFNIKAPSKSCVSTINATLKALLYTWLN